MHFFGILIKQLQMSCGTMQWRPTFVQCWKEIRVKAMVIALASFDIGHLKKSVKGEEGEEER